MSEKKSKEHRYFSPEFKIEALRRADERKAQAMFAPRANCSTATLATGVLQHATSDSMPREICWPEHQSYQ